MREVLFGLNVPTSAARGAQPLAIARRAEELGFDFVSANDHPCGTAPSYELWTMLAWIAAGTSRIRVASRVLGVPYRAPAMVAKMAETLDRLSGGRLILGVGAGASDEEFNAFGLPVPSPRDKVDGLEEAVRIIRGLWSEPSFTYEGRLYRTAAANLEPKPPHAIPIWLGTFGDRALAVTGRVADGWIPSLAFAHPEQVALMRERVISAAIDASRAPEDIACIYNMEVRVDHVADPRPSVVSGPPDAIADRLLEFIALGFSGFNFIPVGPDPDQQQERLGMDVLPVVRAGA